MFGSDIKENGDAPTSLPNLDYPRYLACDIDGVLYPYMEKMRQEISSRCGRDLPEATNYDLKDCWEINAETWHDAHRHIFSGHDEHAVQPISGSVAELCALADMGVRIDYVTVRAHFTKNIGGDFELARAITAEWIKEHFPQTQWTTIHCVPDKRQYPNRSAVMIEDNPREVVSLREDGRQVLILDQPYNQHAAGRRHFWGKDSLREALKLQGQPAFGSPLA